jgi:hypothetical protein
LIAGLSLRPQRARQIHLWFSGGEIAGRGAEYALKPPAAAVSGNMNCAAQALF